MNYEQGNDCHFSVQSSVVHSLRPCWTAFSSILRECSAVVPRLRLAGRARRESSRFEVFGTSNPELQIAFFSHVSPILPVPLVSLVYPASSQTTQCKCQTSESAKAPNFSHAGSSLLPLTIFPSFRTDANHHSDLFGTAAKRRMPWLRHILSLHKP